MMMGPGAFYEENIKGKSVEEIQQIIAELQAEIRELKLNLENPNRDITALRYPDDETIIWCNHLYIERAKAAIAEAGGKDIPTTEERMQLNLTKI